MTTGRSDILICEPIITGKVSGLIALKSEMSRLSIRQVQQCQPVWDMSLRAQGQSPCLCSGDGENSKGKKQ